MTPLRNLAAIAAFLLLPGRAAAQSEGFVPLGKAVAAGPGLDRTVERPLRGLRGTLLRELAEDAGLRLVFAADLPGLAAPVDLPARRAPVRDRMLELLSGTALELRVAADGRAVLAVVADPPADTGGYRVHRGTVVDSADGTPVVLATASVGPARTTTGADGRFAIGTATRAPLRIRAIGYAPRSVPAPAGERDTLDYGVITLAAIPFRLADVVVSPSRFASGTVAVTARTVDRETLERTTQIGEDAYRAINRLPGVGNNDNTAAFRVRGAPHDELYVSLDGLVLDEPFHLKDFDNALSILDPQALGGVELITGGFPARFGDRLTGVLAFSSVDRLPGPEQHQVGLSIGTVRALGSGGFDGERGSWLASVRRGYLDLILAIADPSSNVRPRYFDAFGKVTWRVATDLALSLHGLAAQDGLNFQEDVDEPDIDSRYGNVHTWARLRTTGAGRFRVDAVGSVSHLSWQRLGTRVSPLDNAPDLFVDDRRSLTTVGLRTETSYEFAPWLVGAGGAEVRTGHADYAYLNWQRSFASTASGWVQRFDSTAADRDVTGTTAGGFLTARIRPGAGLIVEAGGRFDHWSTTAETAWAPRFLAVWSPVEGLSLRGAWGRYAQGQGLHQLQVQDGVDTFRPAERAEHRVAGVDLALDGRHDVRLEGYQRRYRAVRPRFVNLDGSQELFPELNYDRFLLAPERSDVRGVEASVRGFERRVTWSAVYQWQRGRDRLAGEWTAREFDQRHAASVDVGWQAGEKWYLSGAVIYHSGWPYTDAEFTVKALPDGSLVLGRNTGPINANRLPAYHRVDLRATRDFPVGHGRIRAFLEIFNVFDRENLRGFVREPVFTPEGGLQRTRIFDEDLYPRLLSFGVYWAF
ncbi:MAG: TonB-dependent receptor [Gemmatimonadales bacterium]